MSFKNRSLWSYIFLVVVGLLIISGYINRNIQSKLVKRWHFKGPVEKIKYNIQGTPLVTIHDKEYNLYWAIWHNDVKIYKGDTLIKEKGDQRIKLIRPNAKDTIYFNTNK
ncbi:hypothetical protein [Mucilaginibacter aquariorum]|uniref:Uncharacterized protein n=1 Tax=Mucilaginibacter aquariorum TaxID=2967225 RepID=A0ABT1T4C1_9SPHI|nr:hypothetical protein [Mucilaginibacter aquariorum]MCQ6959462.1 hypothetical protein [Mucilaginibacter aquariorum]